MLVTSNSRKENEMKNVIIRKDKDFEIVVYKISDNKAKASVYYRSVLYCKCEAANTTRALMLGEAKVREYHNVFAN